MSENKNQEEQNQEVQQELTVGQTQGDIDTSNFQFIGVDDLTEEEKRKVIEQVNNLFTEIYSVEQAIIKASDDAYLRNESFRQVREYLNEQSKMINERLLAIDLRILQNYGLKVLAYILNSGAGPILDSLNNKGYETRFELKNLCNLLKALSKTLNVLEKYGTALCNQEIYDLIVLIHGKAAYLIQDYNDFLKVCQSARRHIVYMPPNQNQEQIRAFDENINAYVQVLGLYDKTPGDK